MLQNRWTGAMRKGVVGCSSQEIARRRMQGKDSKCASTRQGARASTSAARLSSRSSRSRLPGRSARQALLRVRNKRCNTDVPPQGRVGTAAAQQGHSYTATRHDMTNSPEQGSTRHEGRQWQQGAPRLPAGVLRQAALPASPPCSGGSPARGGRHAKRSIRTDTTRPPMVALFMVLTASSAASLLGKRTMPKPLHSSWARPGGGAAAVRAVLQAATLVGVAR